MPDYKFEREINKEILKQVIENKLGIIGVTIKTFENECVITTPTLTKTQERQMEYIIRNHNTDVDANEKFLKKFTKKDLMKTLYNEIDASTSLSAELKNYMKRLIELL